MQKYDFAHFKQSINLSQYAAAKGYELASKKSTRSSLVMRHANGDKIIISKKGANWVYFSVHDDTDNGTILDFIEKRTGQNLSEIGEELAAWSGGSAATTYTAPEIHEQTHDPERIKWIYQWLKPIGTHPYLTETRKIPLFILRHHRFRGQIFEDRYGNAVFAHRNTAGLCGLELKNHDKGVFLGGSEKALWLGNIEAGDRVLTLAEAPIDALSHFTLFRPQHTAYGAVSGSIREKQLDYLLQVIQKMPQLETIILAVDHDEGGEKIACKIENYLKGIFTGEIIRHIPEVKGMDWNDVLKSKSG